uniref:CPXV219 protein n=1 Tax=Cowpox virus TaxID=10243 RepID=A0A0K2YYC5_COWPX|nr:hypothetical protein pCPXV0030 [Cowpox virus]
MGLHINILMLVALSRTVAISLKCYRKVGFYNLYGSNDSEQENYSPVSVENYDYLLKTEILNIDNNIPWKNITDSINNSFIEKCNNCSDNTIYNITIKSWTNYTLVNVTTDNSVYLNVSSDIVINKTGNITTFINNTVNGNLSISLNDTLITINLMNITFIINSTNCEGVSVKKATAIYVNDTLSIYTESEPVSIVDPFITLDELYNCSFSKPINYVNISNTEFNTNTTTCKNETDYTPMDISYVINDNITFISNITSSTKYINSCVNSSLSLQIAAVRIPVLFNKTMEQLGITPGSDSEAYFMCRVTGSNCDLSILLNKASKNVMDRQLSKTPTRQKRSTEMTGNHFCLHKNYGMDTIDDCNSYVDNRVVKKITRARRSPKKAPKIIKSEPIDPNDVLVFRSMDELGARPRIPRSTTDIQVGYRGTDGSVMGDENIYETIRDNIYSQVRDRVVSNGMLDSRRLPTATRTIIGNAIESKMTTANAVIQIVKNVKTVDDNPYSIIYEKLGMPTDRRSGLVIDSENPVTGILNVPTSTGLYSEPYTKPSKDKRDYSLTAYSTPKNQARLETIYETIKMPGTTNNNDGSRRTSPIYDNVGNTKDSLTYVNINKEPIYINDPRFDGQPNRIGVRRSSSSSSDIIVTTMHGHQKKIDELTYSEYKDIVMDYHRRNGHQSGTYDDVRLSSRSGTYDDVGISNTRGDEPNLRRSNAIRRKPGHREDVQAVNINLDKREQAVDSICSSTSRTLICNIREQSNGATHSSIGNRQITNNNNNNNVKNVNIDENNKYIVDNNNGKYSTKKNQRLSKLAGKNNRMNMMMAAIAVSAQSSFTSARATAITTDNTPKDQKIVSLVTTALSQVGGTLAITGGTMGAIAGISIHAVSGLIDVFTSIYYIISGTQPPVDPAIEKFSTYTQHMETKEAGSISCLMPDSQLTITLAYRHKEMNTEAERKRGEYTDIIPSKVYYLKNSFISYTATVKLICPLGQLRLMEADVNTYATLINDKKGVKYYLVHGILELLSHHPTSTFTCGSEPGVIFTPFEQKLSDMQLLRLTTAGEPETTKDIPSNVCDLYPLKRFYLLTGNCPHDMTQTAITYVTCSTLLRMATYQENSNRWILMNPFFTTEGENVQLFTFSKYDFSDIPIDVNKMLNAEAVCTQVDNGNCFWSEAMLLEDVTQCASRIRKMYVTISTVNNIAGYNSFILTCPSGSAPFMISNSSISVIPMNTRRTSMRFASANDAVALVSCMHNSNPNLKSDIIHLTFTSNRTMYPNYKNYNNEKDKVHLFKYGSVGMPYRSTHCKRLSENPKCKHHRYHIGKWKPIEYRFTKHKLPMIRLTTNYHGELSNAVVSKMKKYFTSPINIKLDISDIDKVYDDPEVFWIFAKERLRTFSAISVTLFPCSVIAGHVNIVDFSHLPVNDTKNSDGYYARYMFIGSIEKPTEHKTIEFTYRKEHGDNVDSPYGKCKVFIDIETKELKIHCPEFTIPMKPFNNYSVNNLCVTMVTSRDHCADQREHHWGGAGYWGYTSIQAHLEFESCSDNAAHNEPFDNFCYRYHTWNYPPAYDACGSAMILGYAPIFVESRIISPPYIKEFVYDTSKNEYASRTMYQKIKKLYNEYDRLMEMTSNAIIDMSNAFGNALTDKGREIFRLNTDYVMLESLKEENKYKLEALQNEIESTLNEIFIKSMTYDEITSVLRSAINTRCCVINETDVYKYYPFEKYLCGEYNDYIVVYDDERYLRINDTLINERTYNASNVPVVTCFEISLMSISEPEQREELESTLFTAALEDVINELFTEYDKNLTSELGMLLTKKDEVEIIEKLTTGNMVSIVVIPLIAFIVSIIILLKYNRRKIYNVRRQTIQSDRRYMMLETISSFNSKKLIETN